jgi:hypothetical protein
MRKQLGAVALLFCAATVRAQTTAFSPDPYIDNETVVVARADLTRIDTAALQKFITDALPAPADKEVTTGLAMARMAADAFLNNVKQRGVHDAYVLISQPDAWPGRQPLAVLFPLPASQDAKPLVDFLGNYGLTTAVLPNNVVYFGQEIPLHRLQSLKPTPRPDLQLPPTESAIEIVYGNTADTRRVIQEMLSRFPSDIPAIGGASTDFATTGFRNITITLDLSSAPAITLTGNFNTPADATQCAALLKSAMNAWLATPDHEQAIDSPAGPQIQKLETDVLQQLNTQPTAPTQISFHFGPEQLRNYIQTAAPAVDKAREQSQRMASMSNLRQISIAAILYNNDHKDTWPQSFDDLAAYMSNKAILTNPADPQHRAYILHPWTSEQIAVLIKSHAATTPIAYEPADDDNAPIAVAYLDGHVELLHSKKNLNDAIAAAEAVLKN